jgi:hypothetical protein
VKFPRIEAVFYFLGQGFHFGVVKLEVKSRTSTGVDFTTAGVSNHETGKVIQSPLPPPPQPLLSLSNCVSVWTVIGLIFYL